MRTLRPVGLLIAALLSLAACVSGSAEPEVSDAAGSYSIGADEFDMGSAEDGDLESADTEGGEREVITTGSLTLVTGDVAGAIDEVIGSAEGLDGWVESRYHSTRTEYQNESAWLTLRIPAAELTTMITAVEKLGEVREVQISRDDVTRHGRDLDARIVALEASTERLLELMAQADTSEALIAAEAALSERQGELEALRSERRYLSDQVAMSTLEVSIQPIARAEFDRGGFIGGVFKGWNSLISAASGLLVGIGAALPWLVVLGIPLAGTFWSVRRRRRQRRTAEQVG